MSKLTPPQSLKRREEFFKANPNFVNANAELLRIKKIKEVKGLTEDYKNKKSVGKKATPEQ